MDFFFRHRSSLVLILVWPIAAWALGTRTPTGGEIAIGVLLVGAGAALRLASLRLLGRGARVHQAGMRGGLSVAGPYAYTRNPLYVAASLVVVGLGFVAGGSWLSLPLLPATFAVYTPGVLSEERALAAAGGESFRAYAAAVPRWIGWRCRLACADVEHAGWGEILGREFRLVPGLALAVTGILAVRNGILPIRQLLDHLDLPISNAALVAIALLGAAAANSLAIERKRSARAARRMADHSP